jgi:hypothetical protein
VGYLFNTYPYSSVGGNGADGEDRGNEDGVGDAELKHRLQETSVTHNIAHPVLIIPISKQMIMPGKGSGHGIWTERKKL